LYEMLWAMVVAGGRDFRGTTVRAAGGRAAFRAARGACFERA
jgi:hypothetical protein